MKLPIRYLVPSLLFAFIATTALPAEEAGMTDLTPATPSETAKPNGPRDGKRAQSALQQRMAQLEETLQLTADQKEKIKDIWTKEAVAAKDGKGKDRRNALMATRNQVRAVLTADQQTKFDAMKPEGPARKGKGKKAE